MKNSITMLSIVLTVCGNAVFANNSTTASTSKAAENFSRQLSDYNDLTGAKYVSYADSNLIASELGGLKKSSKTIAEIIGDDLKITEAKLASKVSLKKKQAKKQIFKPVIKN